MRSVIWLLAGTVCAQFGGLGDAPAEKPAQAEQVQAGENAAAAPSARPATSRIVAVTVYQGRALVTREVAVPEGEGIMEILVSSLPEKTEPGTLSAEGGEGITVIGSRFQSRPLNDDAQQKAKDQEEQIRRLATESERLGTEIADHEANLSYLQKLEGFTTSQAAGEVKNGRLDLNSVISLSRFIMDRRGETSKDKVALQEKLQTVKESAQDASQEKNRLSREEDRITRDAVVIVKKARPEPGLVRLSYFINSAAWTPQYRLQGGQDDTPVRVQYLARVSQETGEDWANARITLSTAKPSLDAAPADLLPLRLNLADASGLYRVGEGSSERTKLIAVELEKSIDMRFPNETPLEDVIKYVRSATTSPTFPEGVPIYLDPIGLSEADKTPTSPISIDLARVPLRTSLRLALKPLGLAYRLKDGVLEITSLETVDEDDLESDHENRRELAMLRDTYEQFGGLSRELGEAILNRQAAGDQTEELTAGDRTASTDDSMSERLGPSVSLTVADPVAIASRPGDQLIELARFELPADYYARATPVLTPLVYRMAKLTNTSKLVLLPGDATIHVGGDFVGRMKLPMVAAGEPFVVGLGVDPQVQIGRRLVRKIRTVQGGNQVFDYEFRIGLRNFRDKPVKVELWDRMPKSSGDAVAVNFVKTSHELSPDARYQRTSRLDNLLRWDLDLPVGTVGDKTLYVDYQFRMEYAKDLPAPQFQSGSLKELPIGGGAIGMGGMGGMSGMGGGMK